MLAWVRRQLSPATVMAFLAFVFATTGGAFAVTGRGGPGPAASSGSSSAVVTAAKSKAKPKGKPGPRGPAGPAGAQGPAGATGPQGPAGPAGAAGAKGENGAAGTNGTNGTNGVSVTSIESKSKIGTCEEGGSALTSASGKTYACNGKAGEEGSPWTAGGTLPVGATETGVWSIGPVKPYGKFPENVYHVPISFSIPLAKPLNIEGASCENQEASCQVHVIKSSLGLGEPAEEVTALEYERPGPGEEGIKLAGLKPETAAEPCPGSVQKPEATPGNFCLYIESDEEVGINPNSLVITGSGSTAGSQVLVYVGTKAAIGAMAYGSWAVTG
jgi:Collagen triple helix repeat (20 copies)